MSYHKQLLESFRVRAAEMAEKSRPTYMQAIASLKAFLNTIDNDTPFPSVTIIADWFAHMYLHGMTVRTGMMYFDAISALYGDAVRNGKAVNSDAFRTCKARIKELNLRSDSRPINDEVFGRVLNMTKTADRQTGDVAVATDILMFSLLNRCMPLMEIAGMKTDSICGLSQESAEIAERRSVPRRKYVFGLRQSERTPLQLRRHMEGLLEMLFRLRGIPISGSPADTIESMWAYAALRCGTTGSDIVAALGHAPEGIPVLSLCSGKEISEDRRDDLTVTVASVFVNNPMQWFAMRLRPKVKFTDVTARFSQLQEELQTPELFYPYDEIARRTGRKIVFEKKPVISDVVFFRSRITDILPMFCRIGDLAWCYTTTGHPGGNYAAIPNKAFMNFQNTIGHFSPDYEIAPLGGLQLHEGEKVTVVGGLFNGKDAEIESIDCFRGNVYRLHILADNGIEWRISADSRQLRASRRSDSQ